jgi:hypothetical protein
MGRLLRGRDWVRVRRERLGARVADGQARLEQARARSPAVDAAVDTAIGVVRRERPVATGILAAALAFRLFALLIPLAYVLVAGLGIFARAQAGPGGGDRLGELVVGSIAAVARTSHRGHLIALVFGGAATLLAALWFALSRALPHPAVPWTALLPGALLFAAGFLAYTWPSRCTSRRGRPAPRRCTGRWGWRWCCWCRCSCSAGWRWPPPSSTPTCGSAALSACG